MDFLEFAAFGLTQITGTSEFRIFKDRYNWWNMCIPCGTGRIDSVLWQGMNLIVSTDQGCVFIFDGFNSWTRIS